MEAETSIVAEVPRREQARVILHAIQVLRSRIVHHYTQAARQESAVTDITFPQWSLMLTLRELGQATLKELAEHLHVSPPSASTMVERLVEMEMLARTPHPNDRRTVQVKITEAGMHAMTAVEEEMVKTIEDLMERMGPRLSQQWCDVYSRIHEILVEENQPAVQPGEQGAS